MIVSLIFSWKSSSLQASQVYIAVEQCESLNHIEIFRPSICQVCTASASFRPVFSNKLSVKKKSVKSAPEQYFFGEKRSFLRKNF